MLIDTHAHVNFNAFKEDGKEVIKRALADNIWLVNVGSQYSTSARAVKIAERYEKGVFAAIGLHPIHLGSERFQVTVDENEEVEFETREESFKKEKYASLILNQKTIAVGEIGLDYHHNAGNKERQKDLFLEQIDFAMEHQKPIIVHCRDAHNNVLEILEEKRKKWGKELRGVVHSFSGRLTQAEKYVELGFCLGFNGIITFARDYDKVISNISLDKLLTETDCPYLTPAPFRGKRNEPLYVQYVADKLAEIKKIPVEKISEITFENARKLFNI